jgi:RNA polymerase sigma-70 factor (ECF subfamily)
MTDEKSRWIASAVERFEIRLLRYASRMVPEQIARDIVQETFLRLWQQDQLGLDGRLAEWLFSVCRNQAVDHIRRESSRLRAAGEIEIPDQVSPEEKTSHSQHLNSVLDLVEKLPFEQKEVIRLKFQEDMSYKEISAITGHSVSYVGVLIHTAMTAMREKAEAKK